MTKEKVLAIKAKYLNYAKEYSYARTIVDLCDENIRLMELVSRHDR